MLHCRCSSADACAFPCRAPSTRQCRPSCPPASAPQSPSISPPMCASATLPSSRCADWLTNANSIHVNRRKSLGRGRLSCSCVSSQLIPYSRPQLARPRKPQSSPSGARRRHRLPSQHVSAHRRSHAVDCASVSRAAARRTSANARRRKTRAEAAGQAARRVRPCRLGARDRRGGRTRARSDGAQRQSQHCEARAFQARAASQPGASLGWWTAHVTRRSGAGRAGSTTRLAPPFVSRDAHATQMAESLSRELLDQTYECMICCEAVKRQQHVWSCGTCFHVFHIKCIQKWAGSATPSDADACLQLHPPALVLTAAVAKWRCPGCQTLVERVPRVPACFCGKLDYPSYEPRGPAPHTCGEPCGKFRSRLVRRHKIFGTQPRQERRCVRARVQHPVPCRALPALSRPDQPALLLRFEITLVPSIVTCIAGQTDRQVRCGADIAQPSCGQVSATHRSALAHVRQPCQRLLNCGLHACGTACHEGPCAPCALPVTQQCYCGKRARDATCGQGVADQSMGAPRYFSCAEACQRMLACGSCVCPLACHAGPCQPCPRDPAVVKASRIRPRDPASTSADVPVR